MPHLHRILTDELGEIRRLARAVEEFCNAHGLSAEAAKLNLALDEILTNVIDYGFEDDGRDHLIAVDLSVDAGVVTVVVRDNGRAFDPLARTPPDTTLDLDSRPIGGLGIHFVRTLMDDVSYRREDGHNVLTLVKHIHESAP